MHNAIVHNTPERAVWVMMSAYDERGTYRRNTRESLSTVPRRRGAAPRAVPSHAPTTVRRARVGDLPKASPGMTRPTCAALSAPATCTTAADRTGNVLTARCPTVDMSATRRSDAARRTRQFTHPMQPTQAAQPMLPRPSRTPAEPTTLVLSVTPADLIPAPEPPTPTLPTTPCATG